MELNEHEKKSRTFDFRKTFPKMSGRNLMPCFVPLLLDVGILSFNYSLEFSFQNQTAVDRRHKMLKETGIPYLW